MMNGKELNNFIHFSDQKNYIENELDIGEWVTVYKKKKQEKNGCIDDIYFYSCLVSEERKQKKYPTADWISSNRSKLGSVIEYTVPLRTIDQIKQKLFSKLFHQFYISNYLWTPEQLKKRDTKIFKIKDSLFKKLQFLNSYKVKKIKKYQRFSEEGVESLIYIRTFSARPTYIEISNEFCHYFDLYEDRNNNVFYSFDESGNPIEIIKIIGNSEVRIKRKYINEFLHVKKMWLCVQFDNRRWMNQALLKKPVIENFKTKDSNLIYSLNSGDGILMDERNFVRFLGRRFINYKEVYSLWYEREDEKYESFSFINENGEETTFTCGGYELGNCYDENEKIPDYLTPISFCREVLKKYYDKPSQYSVKDNYLNCLDLWGLQIDIQDNRVVVFLGDLAKLPYLEQKYWRSYNITEKAKISKVNWERSFECRFTETDRPDLFFKKTYKKFNQNWYKKYNWHFFKLLSDSDKHCFDSLRVPLNEEQSEFDTQILNLVKVFIESINIKKIKEIFPASYERGSKTIDTVEEWLISKNIRSNDMLEFLRKLQKLRSKGSAHIKDKDYENIIDYFKSFKEIRKSENKKEIFSVILTRCIWTINTLNKLFLGKEKDSEVENKTVSNQSNLMEI